MLKNCFLSNKAKCYLLKLVDLVVETIRRKIEKRKKETRKIEREKRKDRKKRT
jgi:hypothetical protein